MQSDGSAIGTVEICGDDLLSIDVATPMDAQALAEQLRGSAQWCEVVAGMTSVVVQFDATEMTADAANRQIAAVLEKEISFSDMTDTLLEIPVVYGGDSGPDFEEICQQTGLSADELVELHTGAEYRVDLVGFTPGFVYVGGLDHRLSIPRRAEPRQHVAAGAVGIADGRTGLYAVAGPGGWPLIGRTSFKLFDPNAENPFPISPGMRIRFIACESPDAGT